MGKRSPRECSEKDRNWERLGKNTHTRSNRKRCCNQLCRDATDFRS